jgi:hypothetical protein
MAKTIRSHRNVAVIWMLFGSEMRVNEVAHLKVADVSYRDGALKVSVALVANEVNEKLLARPLEPGETNGAIDIAFA